ncbi:unnamed protein product [Thelazia callipaeda]|uniref:ShKT domain-containing protein n=1 Tax=Thelazia callipaeda TaxID=103827 RepID=A0A0N5CNC3_THECL|nr:unnamed protein product [Thelazia callipaeda]
MLIDADQESHAMCTDKSSHCKRRSHLCDSNAFREVMQSLCKKTCNLCDDGNEDLLKVQHEIEEDNTQEASEEEDEISDKEHPESETDIDESEEVPEEYVTVLPTTTKTYFTTKNVKTTHCIDLSPDCEGKQHLCSELTYARLMRKECPKTCQSCETTTSSRSHRLPSHHLIHGSSRSGMHVSECRDIASDCRASLCDNQSYRQLMETVCKETCSLC